MLVCRPLRSLLCHIALMFIALVVGASQASAHDALLVGNSFMMSNAPFGVRGVMAGFQEAQGGFEGGTLSDVSKGGYTLTMHADDAQSGGALNTYLVSGDAAEYPFQSVVLQEQSQIAAYHIADNPLGPGYLWDESLIAVESLNQLASARGADTVFLMTWGYRDGDASVPAHLFEGFADFPTMQAALSEGYERYIEAFSTMTRTLFLAPAGLAFQHVYQGLIDQGLDPLAPQSPFSALYSGDGRHPAPEGSYLAGCVLYASLTGRDPRRVSWAPEGIAEARGELLREACAEVSVVDPYTPREMVWGPVLRYPFMVDFADMVLDAEVPHLGASDLRPTGVLQRVTPPLPSLVLGQGERDAGRLGVLDGGRLSVAGTLELGRAGEGQLDLRGGEVDAEVVRLADDAEALGVLQIGGGTLTTGAIDVGEGAVSVTMTGGLLVTPEVHAPLRIQGGVWRVEAPGVASQPVTLEANATLSLSLSMLTEEEVLLALGDNSVLAGSLSLWIPEGEPLYIGSYPLLEGVGLDLNMLAIDAAALGQDAQVSWQVDTTTERTRLWLHVTAGPTRPRVNEADGNATEGREEGDAGEDDVGPEVAQAPAGAGTVDVQGRDGVAPPQPDQASAGGCHSASSLSAPPWWMLLVMLVVVRRRSYRPSASQASMMRLG